MNIATHPEPFPILTGPTAVGKTALSLELAERLNAEIISADSRQVYRELTVGTAKPGADELARVPHHFVNELSLGFPFSAGAFAHAANARIDEILERGRIPLIVGGSTLYLHALQFGFADVPPISRDTRRHLETRLVNEGAATLFKELKNVDPVFARTLDPTKTQRLVRGLEVYYDTGRTLTSYHLEQEPPPFTFKVAVLQRPRAELYKRINLRVDRMFEEGLLEEARDILDAGFDLSLNPLRTIGYQEAFAHLKGEINYHEMVRLVKRNSRRYAKRQMTWFRRYSGFFSVAITDLLSFFLQDE